jgi:transketolase
VKPLDRAAILAAVRETGAIMTVEEHNILGGLGGAVAEVIAQAGVGIPFAIKGLPDAYVHKFGSHDWLLDQYGFAPEALADSARNLLKRRGAQVQP